jgi:hypothetical protein
MAFKCYCLKCETPLYFEEAVPMPQVCFGCLEPEKIIDTDDLPVVPPTNQGGGK